MNSPESTPPSAAQSSATADRSAGSRWTAFLLAGLIGGVVAGVGLFQVNGFFKLPTETPAAGSNDPALATYQVAMDRAAYQNSVLSIAWMGLVVACSLGLAAGVVAGSIRALLSGAIIGAVVGAALGTGAGFLMHWVLAQIPAGESTSMYRILAAHAVAFAAVGIASAVAVAAAMGQIQHLGRDCLFGILGGVLAAVVFIPVGVPLSFVALGNPDQPIPEGTAYQIVWGIVAGMVIAFGLAAANATSHSKPAAGSSPAH